MASFSERVERIDEMVLDAFSNGETGVVEEKIALPTTESVHSLMAEVGISGFYEGIALYMLTSHAKAEVIKEVVITSRISLSEPMPDLSTFSAEEKKAHDEVGNPVDSDLEVARRYKRASFVWFASLTSCMTVSSLKVKNITNYFKGKGLSITAPSAFLDVLSASKNRGIKYLTDEKVYENIISDPFVRMHTNFSSSAMLCDKCFRDAPKLFRDIFTEDEMKTVLASLERPYDRALNAKIPDKVKSICALYLLAARAYPEDWFQGNKALDDILVSTRIAAQSFFKAYVDALGSIKENLEGKSVDEVLESMPDVLKK
jgi:hypothetical protein